MPNRRRRSRNRSEGRRLEMKGLVRRPMVPHLPLTTRRTISSETTRMPRAKKTMPRERMMRKADRPSKKACKPSWPRRKRCPRPKVQRPRRWTSMWLLHPPRHLYRSYQSELQQHQCPSTISVSKSTRTRTTMTTNTSYNSLGVIIGWPRPTARYDIVSHAKRRHCPSSPRSKSEASRIPAPPMPEQIRQALVPSDARREAP